MTILGNIGQIPENIGKILGNIGEKWEKILGNIGEYLGKYWEISASESKNIEQISGYGILWENEVERSLGLQGYCFSEDKEG